MTSYSRSSATFDGKESCETILTIDSINGLTGSSPNSFIVTLDRSIVFDTIKLNFFSCPNTIYNLTDSFILEEFGFPPVTGTMPLGFYTINNIDTRLKAYLESISPSGATYTVTVDFFQAKITIASTTNFKFNDITVENNFYFALGYNDRVQPTPQVLAASQISSGNYNFLSVYGNIYVAIKELPNPQQLGTNRISYNFVIPATNISRTVSSFTSQSGFFQWAKASFADPITQLTITLYDFRGRLLPIAGGNTSIIFGVVTRRTSEIVEGIHGPIGFPSMEIPDGKIRYIS